MGNACRNTKIQSLAVVFACFSWLFVNCAKAPEQKLTDAQEALDSAKAAGAAEYAKGEFLCAEDFYYSAFNDIQDEKKHFLFLRNYDDACRMLDSSICSAQKAGKTAEIVKWRIEAEKKLAAERVNSFKAKYLSQGKITQNKNEQKTQTAVNRKPL